MGKMYVTKKKNHVAAGVLIGIVMAGAFMMLMYLGNRKIMIDATDQAVAAACPDVS